MEEKQEKAMTENKENAAPQGPDLPVKDASKPSQDGRAAPAEPAPAHTDHPSRHWDRTCPACIAESNAAAGSGGQAQSEALQLAQLWNDLPDDFGPDHISMKGLKMLAREVIRLSAASGRCQPAAPAQG